MSAEELAVIDAVPAVRAHEAMVTRAEVSVDEVVAQRDKVKAVMERVMRKEVHYGHIPGVDKPTLFKPGAEVLNTTFRLAPSYQSERIFDGDHLTVIAKCVLTHAPSGIVLGEGEGLCSTREAKYAYRNAARTCPACGAPAIIKGKVEYGGGWLCWKKRDGCGAKYPEGDGRIEQQPAGKVANEDIADSWNTVLKMADKRALIAAVLNCTAASDIFTQDVEDTAAEGTPDTSSAPPAEPQTFEAPSGPATAAQKSKLDELYAKFEEFGEKPHNAFRLAAASDERQPWEEAREALSKEKAAALIRRAETFIANVATEQSGMPA